MLGARAGGMLALIGGSVSVGPVGWCLGGAALIGLAAYSVYQGVARSDEEKKFNERLEKLEALFVEKAEELAVLRTKLGEKNYQVVQLAHEVQRLRVELDAAKRAA